MARYRFEPRATGITPARRAAWREQHLEDLPPVEHARAYIEALRTAPDWERDSYDKLTRSLGRAGIPTYGKAAIRQVYLQLVEAGELPDDDIVRRRLKLKPVRTQSGIVPIAVMVKPAPCPGRCIFCPTDVRMPKSYLSNEPAGQRAVTLAFDPFLQTRQRIEALRSIGHSVDKVELIVLGGTWSSYDRGYQAWFVQRMFDALNGHSSESLEEAHRLNERANCRSTGLVVETRPDHVTVDELRWLRSLGVTRVQLGAQSFDDEVLRRNKRGHTVEETRKAVRLLRSAGFKVTLHWMPNLLGATPASDLADYKRLWADPALRPDELKIYPTGLLRGTELYDHYEAGDYHPYTEAELLDLLSDCLRLTPETCRLNRVMRDIPAPEIAAGTTTSNLRQIVEKRLRMAGTPCRDIRAREVRDQAVEAGTLRYQTQAYNTDHSRELFLSAVTPGDRLAGFLRLSLPVYPAPLTELTGAAIIRQVQVYGPVAPVGDPAPRDAAQHQGIGRTLIERALHAAREAEYSRIAVIAAVGTRDYYRRFGFQRGELYMSRAL